MEEKTFDTFFTDETSAPVVQFLKELCVSENAEASPIFLLGPTGVGKTYLCRAVQAARKDVFSYSSEEFLALLIHSVEQKLGLKGVIEAVADKNVIIDDADLILMRGEAIWEDIFELIRIQREMNRFVLLSMCCSVAQVQALMDKLPSKDVRWTVLSLLPPSAQVRLAYCRKLLLEYGMTATEEEIRGLADANKILPQLHSAILQMYAASR